MVPPLIKLRPAATAADATSSDDADDSRAKHTVFDRADGLEREAKWQISMMKGQTEEESQLEVRHVENLVRNLEDAIEELMDLHLDSDDEMLSVIEYRVKLSNVLTELNDTIQKYQYF